MIILLLFAFLSGLVTIAAPCIWPLLPIVLSASATGGKSKPLGVTLGIISSFAFFTLTISYVVKIIPFDPNVLRLFAVIVISFLGLVLVIPKLSQILEGYVSRFSGKVGSKIQDRQGFGGGFITGVALGVVWSPCAGPILATIATLAATRAVNLQVILVTVVYVIGVGIPLFLFAFLGNKLFTKSRVLSKHTGRIQQVFGIIMILTALAIYTNFDKALQAKLLNIFPSYSNSLTQLESNVQTQLNGLKGSNTLPEKTGQPLSPMGDQLPNLGAAPEFTGINKWLNTDKPLSIKDLRGKVVLVDFWTYTCINCIRTLPFVTSWYDKYKDKGFVVIGVHTPEFEFEKNTDNVKNAIQQYKIHYPVAQDNDYSTWQTYNNQYWPAEYLIDAQGNIRRTHFGEGEYDQTEMKIKELLEEAGKKVDNSLLNMKDQTPTGQLSPETYVGSKRIENISSSEQVKGGVQTFSIQDGLPLHYFSFGGTWDIQPEYAVTAKDSTLDFHFFAKKVFLVITPKKAGDEVKVSVDKQPGNGGDVKSGIITLDTPRLYELVSLKKTAEDHTLHLEFLEEGTEVFAFTFG